MSTLKVNAISDAAGANGNAITLATDGTCTAKVTNNLSNRNLIINGAMQIAQRGTSDTSSGGYKTVDRFKPQCGGTDDAPTQAQISLTTSDTGPWAKGFRKAVQWTNGNQTAAGGGDYFEILYKTEGHDISSCGWDYTDPNSKITLSFWVKSSVAQNFYGFLRNDESTDKLYPFETGSLSANTWTKITKVIPGHADLTFNNGSGTGLQIHWTMFYGTNYTNNATSHQWMTLDIANFTADQTSTWYTTNDATFALTGVQLEVGSSATEFEHRSYGDELARCQRYCQRVYVRGYSAVAQTFSDSTCSAPIHLKTEMRGEPSITLPNTTSQNAAGKIAFTNHTGSWPATHGTLSGTYITTSKFNVDGTGFTSSSFGAAGNAINLYASSNSDGTRPYILCEAEI